MPVNVKLPHQPQARPPPRPALQPVQGESYWCCPCKTQEEEDGGKLKLIGSRST